VAASIGALLAFFASGSRIIDALGIGRVHLDLTWETSSTGDTSVVLELEALVATFALGSSWSRTSLTGGVTGSTGLSFNSLDVSIIISNLSLRRSLNFVLAEVTG
jgi:hypothetical protein